MEAQPWMVLAIFFARLRKVSDNVLSSFFSKKAHPFDQKIYWIDVSVGKHMFSVPILTTSDTASNFVSVPRLSVLYIAFFCCPE